ncbi:MAG TPA: hypothetical protein ENK04_02535 [Gammaproteobacteria bacterium]|nr:hypothetical protein [Gammaproteobacteria bacterium]
MPTSLGSLKNIRISSKMLRLPEKAILPLNSGFQSRNLRQNDHSHANTRTIFTEKIQDQIIPANFTEKCCFEDKFRISLCKATPQNDEPEAP